MNLRKLLGLTSRAMGAGRAVKRRRGAPWAARQVVYIAGGKATAAIARKLPR